ncbi:MAG: DUF3388 domain-containing protein [Syntrophothermus sp.]
MLAQWYLEYRIHKNRPGLLGDVATLLGMLRINIVTVNGLTEDRRGFLLTAEAEKIEMLQKAIGDVEDIQLTALRPPQAIDLVALRHGRSITESEQVPPVYRFVREELGLMIDLMGQILKEDKAQILGIRGMPKVGKTEAAIAACVNASKRWIMVSGTIFRQTLRTRLTPEETASDCVLLLDAITSTSRPLPEHRELVRQVLALPLPKVVEHPDIFVREGILSSEAFCTIIELRREPDEVISYERIASSPSAFDLS